MRNPFSSEYASAAITVPTASPVTPTAQGNDATMSAANIEAAGLDTGIFEFEPERYGLGKPKRIVIRGKISRD